VTTSYLDQGGGDLADEKRIKRKGRGMALFEIIFLQKRKKNTSWNELKDELKKNKTVFRKSVPIIPRPFLLCIL
jgi:hypothetical protein